MSRNKNLLSTENTLDNSILLTIFCHLSIVDRIKIERVSKRWNELSKASWSNLNKLNLQPATWGFSSGEFLDYKPKHIKLSELTKVLKRCGKYLEEIDVSETNDNERNSLNLIARYCPNVKLLKAKVFSVDSITALNKNNCKNLIELRLRDCSFEEDPSWDAELSCLFKNNESLRVVEFLDAPKFTGSCLLNLSLLETLNLCSGCSYLKKEYLLNAIRTMNNLKVFKMFLDADKINNLIVTLQKITNLEELYLESYLTASDFLDFELGKLFKRNQKLKILKFRKIKFKGECLINLNGDCIEELSLDACEMLDCCYLKKCFLNFNNLNKFGFNDCGISSHNYNEVIQFISLLENLKYLKLARSSYRWRFDLGSDNFVPLSSLINLEEINLESLSIPDEFLIIIEKNLHNIKKVSLISCTKITDNGLYPITSLSKLEYLTLINLNEITDAGFNTMLKLKKIHFAYCRGIKNDSLNKILSESNELNYLYISDCYSVVKSELLLFANEITRIRTNNIILYIQKDILDEDWSLEITVYIKKLKRSPFLKFTSEVYL